MAGPISAGVVMYRRIGPTIEVLLAHPGGPFWAKKDTGAWSIPKGLYEPDADSDMLVAAIREFTEEVGTAPPKDGYRELGSVKLSSGKTIAAWAVEGDLDPTTATSNTFEMEWPPKSGRRTAFPEVDRVEWFTVDAARPKMNKGQLPLLDRLAHVIAALG